MTAAARPDPSTAASGTLSYEQAGVNYDLIDPLKVAAQRAAGLDALEILDATHAIAMFAWANRLMQTLGEPVYPD